MTEGRDMLRSEHSGANDAGVFRSHPATISRSVSAPLLMLVVGLGLPGTVAADQAPVQTSATAAPVASGQAGIVARGKYLADIGDCAACHTASNGPKFAGGQYMETPFGPLSTPNITPDKATGIGDMTDDQFYRVLHEGIGKNGEHLYPAMPYPWYTKVTRDDVLAIKAYLFSLAPVHAPRKPSHIRFPFNIRAGLGVWDTLFLNVGTFKPDPKASPEVNRGAYLVQGLGHCGECHNSSRLLGNAQIAGRLQGGQIENWYAPNLTSDVHTGIGKYTDQQLVTYLKTGTDPAMGVAAGPMAQTVHESLHNLTDADLQDIVAYLKSTPAEASYHPSIRSAFTGSYPQGEEAYLTFCASCHQPDGKGLAGAVPALAGNGTVMGKGPETVIRVVLGGIEAQGSYAPMPAIGVGMTDQQVADVTNYVRQAWGNAAPPTAGGGEVGKLRNDTHTMLNFTRPGGCPELVQPALAKAIGDKSNGIGDALRGVTPANMFQTISAIIPKIREAVPGVQQADIVNGLTIAYCPVVAADTVPEAQKRTQLDEFANLVYSQLVGNDQQ